MTRKDFFAKVGFGAAAVLVPSCLAGVATSCSSDSNSSSTPSNVDFTLDVSSGSLATNGGYLVHNGVIVARKLDGSGYIAVSAACTHEGTNVRFISNTNSFLCPNHDATFNASGVVTKGPASRNLTLYQTTINGSTLRVFS